MNIIDMHCDTMYQIYERKREGKTIAVRDDANLHVTLEKMKQGGYLLQNFAAFVELEESKEQLANEVEDIKLAPYQFARHLIDTFKTQTEANQDLIGVVRSFADIQSNEKEGRMSALLTIEEGGVCLGEIEKLREFYEAGARMLTLTWNYENELGHPAAMQGDHWKNYRANEKRPLGLKERGFEFVAEMERLGMIVDVSHLSDDGFFDLCEHATKPFVASHSNSRAMCGHRRNLTDEMLRMLGDRGGVSGLNFCPGFVIAEKDENGQRMHDGKNLLEYLAEHAVHMMNVGGTACVGLGSDFDGFSENGMPGDASAMQDFAWELHKAHVSYDQIDNILYGNVYRLYRELL